ncbi:MAG TPA: PaaI family thioesterase [Thermoanaerobaculia bacterium]|nr:PaaI family thioesterase [Thermoanaerobaculia bacterium]
MKPNTHLSIDRRLCGEPLELGEGTARVALFALPEMAVDDRGLVHGGFVFGLADYAAMLAVNHPHVVLAGAEVRFLMPVVVGEQLVAEAWVEETDGRKSRVRVEVLRDGEAVMSGDFRCVTLAQHVLGEERA